MLKRVNQIKHSKLAVLFINEENFFNMLIQLHPRNPQPRNMQAIVNTLEEGGVIIYPTDTIYGLGCDILSTKAIERICQIKNIQPSKAQFSFICNSLSDLSKYTRSIGTPLYRVLKAYLPGPFTFILPASREVPKILKSKRNTIGLRIPDNTIALSIVEALGRPILSTSLPPKEGIEYTSPEEIHEHFHKLVDIVVDGGAGGLNPSTVIDYTTNEPVILRQGIGIFEN